MAHCRRAVQQIAVDDFQPSAPPPKITYGKRKTLLPLKGTQFRRRADPCDVAAESEDDEAAEQEQDLDPPAIETTARPPRLVHLPGDSPLSEDELEMVYGRDASPVLSVSDGSPVPALCSKTTWEPKSEGRTVACMKKGSAKLTAKRIVRSSCSLQPREDIVKTPNSNAGAQNEEYHPSTPSRRTGSSIAHSSTAAWKSTALEAKTSKPAVSRAAPKTSTAKPGKSKPLARRLPVNELLLVSGQQEERFHNHNPPTSWQSGYIQDPIATVSSSPPKRRKLSSVHEEDDRPCVPLTSLRKRLKTPRFTHKTVVTLRQKHKSRASLLAAYDEKPVLGDGFESFELKVDHRTRRRVQARKHKALLYGFSELELGKGLLPEVKFESSSSELHVAISKEVAITKDQTIGQPLVEQIDRPVARNVTRRVSFSDRIMSDAVKAKLSSVSAPARLYSISDNDDDADDDDDEDNEMLRAESEPDEGDSEHGNATDEEEEDFIETDEDDEPSSPTRAPPSNQKAMRRRSCWSKFCKPAPDISTDPRISLDPLAGITPVTAARTPHGKRRLMEVNERIVDEPAIAPQRQPIIISSTDFTEGEDEDEDGDDQGEGEDTLNSGPPPILTGEAHGLRSILRNHAPGLQDSDTRPEHTAANTRRNSRVINLDRQDGRSRYFVTTAIERLRRPPEPSSSSSSSSSRPRIIIIKKSRTSDRFADRIVQVPASDRVVPDTSQARPGRTGLVATGDRNALKRRTLDAVGTSGESTSKMPGDLKALTRRVSRDAGTLSQGLRRKATARNEA